MYRLIVLGRLEQTAVLFVGIPTVLAILLAVVPKAKTVKGGITKGLTLFLLLSGPLLGEGFICILMASPIFYLVGLLLRPILIRTDMSNLNCHFRLLNAVVEQRLSLECSGDFVANDHYL
jgi:hypothetical protein